MRRLSISVLFVPMTLAVGLALERPAEACSVLACNGDTLPEVGTVPIGLRGFYLSPDYWTSFPTSTSTLAPSVELVDGQGQVLATHLEAAAPFGTWAVLLDAPLTSATTLTLRHPGSCMSLGAPELTTTVTASISAPYPSALGTITTSEPYFGDLVELTYVGADCGPVATPGTWLRVDLAEDPSTDAWSAALRVRLELDGRAQDPQGPAPRSPQQSYAAFHGRDRVFFVEHPCGAPVTRQVALVADSPGYPELRTNTLTVTLACAASTTDDGGTSVPDGFVSDTGSAPERDAGTSATPDIGNDLPGDAATAPDQGPASGDVGGIEEVREEGCACTSTERGTGRGASAFGLALAFGLTRLRRRQGSA
jgi:MYXO-CTERM domain-containing protein